MAVTRLARILVFVTSVAFAVNLSLIRREVVTAYSPEEQKAIVDEHNKYRKNVSPTASNMAELKWNDDLSRKAQDLASKCVFEHHVTDNDGQNLYFSTGKGDVAAPVKVWYDEVADYNYENGCASGKRCGHYTQVVWASTTDVGCGIQHCTPLEIPNRDPNLQPLNGWLVVCNYNPGGNYKGQRPYKTGGQCTECGERQTCKDGLCSDTQ